MGVVGLPSLVTGLAAMSIMAEITFMPGFHGISNSSQWASAFGAAWRLILSWTVFAAINFLLVSFCQILRLAALAQDIVCGLTLRSRPQNASTSPCRSVADAV